MKTYVQVGTGGRAQFFYEAIATTFRESSKLLAFCDVNQTRMDYANGVLENHGLDPIPTYLAQDFDQMLLDHKPDYVIVTTTDRTHHKYINRAMELGSDVITEKPLTVDAKKAKSILETKERTGKDIRVTFNYRYAPHNTKVRELIRDGAIGNVTSVHFEWLLNTEHGADYFRRWHRDKRNSGGLMVHKSTHHFDLVNFWLNTRPETVFAFGDLKFYGKENAEARGITEFYKRGTDDPLAKDDPFALNLKDSETLCKLYYEAEHHDGYLRDQSVFSDGISIEDTMNVLVRYETGAQMSYSLTAYSPWEGFRIAINGDAGRLELDVVEKSYVNAGGDKAKEGALKQKSLKVYPHFAEPYNVEIVESEGGHGGGDPVLLNDIFGIPEEDEFKRAASLEDGIASILTGIAANESMKTGQAVKIKELI